MENCLKVAVIKNYVNNGSYHIFKPIGGKPGMFKVDIHINGKLKHTYEATKKDIHDLITSYVDNENVDIKLM